MAGDGGSGGVAGELVGVMARAEAGLVVVWHAALGKVGFQREDAAEPPASEVEAYGLGVWVAFRAEPSPESRFQHRARSVRAWTAGTQRPLPPPRPSLRSHVHGHNDWEGLEGFVVNVNEREATVWTESVGLVTWLCKGACGPRPPLHRWLALRAEFRPVPVSDSYETYWEATEYAPLHASRSLRGSPLRFVTAQQEISTAQRERQQGNQFAFRLLDGSGLSVEVLRHAFHLHHDHSAQFLFALSDAAAREADGRLRLALLLLSHPRSLDPAPKQLEVLWAAPEREARKLAAFSAARDEVNGEQAAAGPASPRRPEAPPSQPPSTTYGNLLARAIPSNKKPRSLPASSTVKAASSRRAAAGEGVAGPRRPCPPDWAREGGERPSFWPKALAAGLRPPPSAPTGGPSEDHVSRPLDLMPVHFRSTAPPSRAPAAPSPQPDDEGLGRPAAEELAVGAAAAEEPRDAQDPWEAALRRL